MWEPNNMALPSLHKNTGRMAKDWLIGRLFVAVNVAEDPAKPLLLRNWSKQEKEGRVQRDMLLDVSLITHEYDDGSRQKAVNVILGPFCIWFSLMNKPGE